MTRRHQVRHPPDAQTTYADELDTINTHDAQTLDEMFRERVRRSPDKLAYTQYAPQRQQWVGVTWAELAVEVERWQVAFRDAGLAKGDRVAICYKNSIEWIVFDQAALRLGLVVVPLYTADRADNIGYVIGNSGSKLVLINTTEAWHSITSTDEDVSCIEKVIVMEGEENDQIQLLANWLPDVGEHMQRGLSGPEDLASIVYTSGTTGRPKGVMLSHYNMLATAYSGMRSVALQPDDKLLSFLPLSHTFERTVTYYAGMLSGSSVTFNRSIPELSDDLQEVRPTVMVSVPRIFERIHNQIYGSLKSMTPIKRRLFHRTIKTGWHQFQYEQGLVDWHPRLLLAGILDKLVGATVRARFGGQLKYVVVGGAPLVPEVAKTFLAVRIPLLQGYGLTESSPIISVNTREHNRPDSIGLALRGVDVMLKDREELWVKSDGVMMGYWQNLEATKDNIEEIDDGDEKGRWLKTGDRASIDDDGFIRIIGRIKDILVLANGEKVPPTDIEAAIQRDILFEQVMVVGEGRSYLSALMVIEENDWRAFCSEHNLSIEQINSKEANALLLKRIDAQMADFPGYAKIRQIHIATETWTVEAGLITPTLKLKRAKIMEQYADQIEALYKGRGVVK